MPSAMDHVHHLAETIGPRGSTTPSEAEGSAYARGVLAELGLEAKTEEFVSARSFYLPYVLWSALALGSTALLWTGGRWGAVVALAVTAFSTAMVLLELVFRPNLLRALLPKGRSQNVWAVLPPAGEERQQVVLMAHVDTHRTPILFSSKGWLKLCGVLVPLGMGAAVAVVVLSLLGAVLPHLLYLWRLLSLPLALALLALMVLMLQAALSPFTAGANDNATGTGAVLHLAERLKQEPLERTSVWAVISGCEEVGCYGAEAFARAHRDELSEASWIIMDSIGGRGASVAYLTSETMLLTSHADPRLLELAGAIASEHPELDIFPSTLRGAFTEGAIAAKYRFPLLTVGCLPRDGAIPEWHRLTDVTANVDQGVVERAEAFTLELLRAIDG